MAVNINIVGQFDDRQLKAAEEALEKLRKKGEDTATSLRQNFEKASEKMADVGKTLSTAVTLPLVGIAVAGVKFAGELEDAQAMSAEVFGSMAGDVQAFAKDAGRSYGIAEGDATEFANQFGIRLRNIGGLGADAAAELSTDLVALSADLGSAFGTSADVAAEAIGAALTGEMEQLKKYGIIINETSLKQKAMEMGLWDGTGAMDAAAKQQATLALITEQTSLVQGDFARNADGATNSQKILGAELQNAATTIGTILLPVVTDLVKGITGIIEKFQNLSPRTQRLIVIFGGLAAALGPVLVVTAKFIDAGIKVFDTVRKIGPALQTLGTKFVALGRKIAANAVQFVRWAAQTVAQAARATAAVVASIAKQIAQWVVLGAQALAQAARVAAAWLIAMGPIALVIAAVVAVVALIIMYFDEIKAAIGAAWDWVWDKVQVVWDGIVAAIKTAIDWIIWYYTELPRKLLAAAGNAFGWLIEKATAAKDWVLARVDDIVRFVSGLPGRLLTAAGDVFGFLRTKATEAKDWIFGKIGEIVAEITGLPGRLATAGAGMWDWIWRAFRRVLNTLIDGWNSLEFKLPSYEGLKVAGRTIIPGWEGSTLGVPDIPRLAQGGVALSPTLAVVGDNAEGEAIIPLDQLNRFVGGAGMGSTYQITVKAGLGTNGAEVGRQVVEAIRSFERRNGAAWRAA